MRTILLSLFIMFFQVAFCKTTYVPYYFGKVTINSGGVFQNDSSICRDLFTRASSGLYSITVLHDSVTAERVKDIKMAKALAGWSAAAAIVGGVSNIVNPLNNAADIRLYCATSRMIYSSTMLSIINSHIAEKLTKVDVNVYIDNLSDGELCVNDMNRGLIWYMPPHSSLSFLAGNPEINSLRIATVDNSMVDYATIQTGNYLRKLDVDFENEEFWIFPINAKRKSENNNVYFDTVGYVKRNKVTMVDETLLVEEGKKYLKELKKAGK